MAEDKKKGLALHWQILIGIGLGIVAGIVLCKITPYENWYYTSNGPETFSCAA